MNQQEIDDIKSCWYRLKAMPNYKQELGMAIFSRIRYLSPRLGGIFFQVTNDRTPSFLSQHVCMFVSMLDSMLHLLGTDDDVLNDKVYELGRRHAEYGIKNQDLPIFGQALTWALDEILGKKDFMHQTKESWRSFWRWVSLTIIRGAKSAMSKRVNTIIFDGSTKTKNYVRKNQHVANAEKMRHSRRSSRNMSSLSDVSLDIQKQRDETGDPTECTEEDMSCSSSYFEDSSSLLFSPTERRLALNQDRDLTKHVLPEITLEEPDEDEANEKNRAQVQRRMEESPMHKSAGQKHRNPGEYIKLIGAAFRNGLNIGSTSGHARRSRMRRSRSSSSRHSTLSIKSEGGGRLSDRYERDASCNEYDSCRSLQSPTGTRQGPSSKLSRQYVMVDFCSIKTSSRRSIDIRQKDQ